MPREGSRAQERRPRVQKGSDFVDFGEGLGGGPGHRVAVQIVGVVLQGARPGVPGRDGQGLLGEVALRSGGVDRIGRREDRVRDCTGIGIVIKGPELAVEEADEVGVGRDLLRAQPL